MKPNFSLIGRSVCPVQGNPLPRSSGYTSWCVPSIYRRNNMKQLVEFTFTYGNNDITYNDLPLTYVELSSVSIIDELNFALPGLQELAAPVSDSLEPSLMMPTHTHGEPWGTEKIGPCIINGEIPTYPAASADIRFYHFSDTTRTPAFTATAVVMDSVRWIFSVPEIDSETFDLTPGLWVWILWETSTEKPVIAATGQLAIRHTL